MVRWWRRRSWLWWWRCRRKATRWQHIAVWRCLKYQRRSVRASCAHAQTVTPRARAHEPQTVRNTHTERGSEACPNHAPTPTSAPIPRAPPVCPSRAHPPALLKVPQRARTLAMVCQTESRHPLASCITRHFQIGIGRPRRQKRVSGRRWFERLVIGLKETVKVKRHALRARERHKPEEALSSDIIASRFLMDNSTWRASRPR